MTRPVVHINGTPYYWTGKLGTHIATGEPAAEYENADARGERTWVTESGWAVGEIRGDPRVRIDGAASIPEGR